MEIYPTEQFFNHFIQNYSFFIVKFNINLFFFIKIFNKTMIIIRIIVWPNKISFQPKLHWN